MRLIVWGTYDTGKPRVRILLRGLREAGAEVTEIHADVWSDIEDKGTISGGRALAARGWRILRAYPGLIWAFLRAPKPQAVLVTYPGHLDVLVLWLFARLRRVPVVWDVFISAYNTVVEDRARTRPGSVLARVIWAAEWLGVRAARRTLMDTSAHADYLARQYGLDRNRVGHVLVGVEPEAFPPAPPAPIHKPIRVLFYGQFIPLHGIDTIIRAARLTDAADIHWTLIGQGQMQGRIKKMLAETPLEALTWHRWVPYEELAEHIRNADICLGVFGDTGKAERVIPNKVFQILSMGKPLVTRQGADVANLVGDDPAVALVPASDPAALVAAIHDLARRTGGAEGPFDTHVREAITPRAIGFTLLSELRCTAQPTH